MRNFALELDDRAVAIATDGHVLTSAPSAVFDGTSDGTVGSHAWRELHLRPRAISTRHLSAVLTQRGTSARTEVLVETELKARLVEQPIEEGKRIWVVAPAQADAAGLAAVLGITRRLGLSVDGFVDSATVTTAALGFIVNTVVLEFGLHHVAATFVDCDGSQARRRRAVCSERGGLLELYQAWLDLVSSTMVKRTRFDPLHDAITEQQLFESIQVLALEASCTGSATASVTKGTGRFEAELTRDQFAQAAQPIYRAVIGLVHQLRPAGVPIAIVMPQLVARLPGMREELEQFVGCELVGVPDGFAAAATSLLDLPEAPVDATAVSLLRRLPMRLGAESFDAVGGATEAVPGSAHGAARATEAVAGGSRGMAQATGAAAGDAGGAAQATGAVPGAAGGAPQVRGVPAGEIAGVLDAEEATGIHAQSAGGARALEQVSREPLGQRRFAGPAPSHVLWDGRAYAIHADSLVVGRAQETNTRFITLPDGLAGVSRRHCTFVHDGGELVLLDHSTFGTFVNGERVHERVRIYAGDRVRLGEPGVELTLIAVGDTAAARTQT